MSGKVKLASEGGSGDEANSSLHEIQQVLLFFYAVFSSVLLGDHSTPLPDIYKIKMMGGMFFPLSDANFR